MQLILDRVSKQYKNKIAVDRVSLELGPGVYGLPDGGEITFDGLDVSEEAYRDALGYLPQDFGYYPEFTAMDFLLYIAAIKGIPKREAKRRAWELFEVVGLEKQAGKKVRTFSGGMRQRLGIAQALINDPGLIVLDEPTAGLDPKERVRFRNMIERLGKRRIVLLSTHIVSDVEHVADRILLMKDGRFLHKAQSEQELLDEARAKGAVPEDAALEDLYLYYFRDREGGSEEE